jgi:hypothetical protein
MKALAYLVSFLVIGAVLLAVIPPPPDGGHGTFVLLVLVTALAAYGVVA